MTDARALALLESGNAHLAGSRFSEAIAAYREAVAIAPDFDIARRNYARALIAGGQFEEGERAVRAELAREERSDLHHILGTALHMQSRYHEAVTAFDAALVRAPNALNTRHNRAMSLARLGETHTAIAEYEAVAQQGYSTPDLFLNWYAALRRDGREGDAILRDGLRRFPYDVRLQKLLAEARWARGESAPEFVSHIGEALAANPAAGALRGLHADMLLRAGAYEAAERTLRTGLARNPADEGYLAHLSTLLITTGRDDEAIAALAPALQHRPRTDTLNNAAVALLRLGRVQEARAMIERARAAAPFSQIALAHAAIAARILDDAEYGRLYDYQRFVRVFDLAPPAGFASTEAFNDALAARLEQMHTAARRPIDQSARGGTQTDGDLCESSDPLIASFLAQAHAAVTQFANELPSDPEHPFLSFAGRPLKFSGAWSIRLRAHGHHVNHVHTGGWISSAYYVRLPNLGASTGKDGWLKFGEPLQALPGCGPAHWVEPKVGRLALFPSYMWHGVQPFTTDGDRLTIAFDVVPA